MTTGYRVSRTIRSTGGDRLAAADRCRRLCPWNKAVISIQGPIRAGNTIELVSVSGPLAGLITKAIPDLTDSFDLFADGLKAASEAQGDVRS